MFAPFFFFFLNFGLTRPFRPIQADTADTDRVGPIWAASVPISIESAPISAASACVGPIRELPRGTTRHGRVVCGVPPASLHPAASDSGALAWEPRPCIPAKDTRKENITQSVGRATYKEPVWLWENRTGRLTDFTTHFSFIIKATNVNWSADGLAFFIAPNGSNIPANHLVGGSLGLLDAALDNSTQNEIVAIELDTFKNEFDPSDNHVGIDVNSRT